MLKTCLRSPGSQISEEKTSITFSSLTIEAPKTEITAAVVVGLGFPLGMASYTSLDLREGRVAGSEVTSRAALKAYFFILGLRRMESASIDGASATEVSWKEMMRIFFWVESARVHRSPVVAS